MCKNCSNCATCNQEGATDWGFGAPDLYEFSQYQPATGQGFAWSELGASIGDTVQSGVDFLGGNLDANAKNAGSIADINAAQADAIRAEQVRKADQQRQFFKLGIGVLVAVVLVVIISRVKF